MEDYCQQFVFKGSLYQSSCHIVVIRDFARITTLSGKINNVRTLRTKTLKLKLGEKAKVRYGAWIRGTNSRETA